MAPQSGTLAPASDLYGIALASCGPPSRGMLGTVAIIAGLVAAGGGVWAGLGVSTAQDVGIILLILVGCGLAAWIVLTAVFRWASLRSILRPRIAVYGDGAHADEAADRLARSRSLAFLGPVRPLGPVARSLDDASLLRVVADGDVDRVAIILPPGQADAADGMASRLSALAVDVDMYDGARIAAAAPGAMPAPSRCIRRPLEGWQLVAKDIEDRIVGSLVLVLFLPLMAIVALAVKATSVGPVFFKQKRYGFRGREIVVYKFRTMRVEASDYSGRVQTKRDDPRITPLGRFLRVTSLDEVPQLLNVVRGEMSLVGPRPHPIDMRTNGELCQDIVENYKSRYRVRPGITGWAQVNGYRGPTTTREEVEERVRLDNHYIENWSLMFDLRIMLLTNVRLFADERAY